MEFNPHQILGVYGLVVALLIVFIVWRKPRSRDSFRLKSTRFGGGAGRSTLPVDNASTQTSVTALAGETVAVDEAPRPTKILNVFFNYNGHEWDAYEVLGVPAGSSMEAVEEAFIKSTSGVDEASKIFLETAYKAIKNKLG